MKIHDTIHSFVLEGFTHEFGKAEVELADDSEWAKILGTGTKLWLDTGDMNEA